MKRILILLGIVSLFAIGTAESKSKFRFSGQFGVFYSSLSPYGEWIEVDFGYAWRPLHINHRWRPYLHGRWIWTDYGWYWASSEPFGWATYHYGRWTYDDYYGWIWIPDNTWGPAWVEWRYDNNYIGWAPLTPHAQFVINVGVVFSNHWVTPVHYWNFVSCRQFASKQIYNYVEPPERTRRIFGNTRGATNIRADRERIFNAGVDVRTIERRGNVRINRAEVIERDQQNADRVTADSRQMRVGSYRPKFNDQTRGTYEIPETFREKNDRAYDTNRSGEARNQGNIYKDRENDKSSSYEQHKEVNKRERRESAIERIQKDRNNYEQQRTQQREQRTQEVQKSRERQESRQQIQQQQNRGNQRSEVQRNQGRTQQQGEQRTRERRPG